MEVRMKEEGKLREKFGDRQNKLSRLLFLGPDPVWGRSLTLIRKLGGCGLSPHKLAFNFPPSS